VSRDNYRKTMPQTFYLKEGGASAAIASEMLNPWPLAAQPRAKDLWVFTVGTLLLVWGESGDHLPRRTVACGDKVRTKQG